MIMTSDEIESQIFVNSRFVHVKATSPLLVHFVDIGLRWLQNTTRLKQLFMVAFLAFRLDSVMPFSR